MTLTPDYNAGKLYVNPLLKAGGRRFNSSLGGNVRRAIDFREGGSIDEEALKALIRAAVALNQAKARG